MLKYILTNDRVPTGTGQDAMELAPNPDISTERVWVCHARKHKKLPHTGVMTYAEMISQVDEHLHADPGNCMVASHYVPDQEGWEIQATLIQG